MHIGLVCGASYLHFVSHLDIPFLIFSSFLPQLHNVHALVRPTGSVIPSLNTKTVVHAGSSSVGGAATMTSTTTTTTTTSGRGQHPHSDWGDETDWMSDDDVTKSLRQVESGSEDEDSEGRGGEAGAVVATSSVPRVVQFDGDAAGMAGNGTKFTSSGGGISNSSSTTIVETMTVTEETKQQQQQQQQQPVISSGSSSSSSSSSSSESRIRRKVTGSEIAGSITMTQGYTSRLTLSSPDHDDKDFKVVGATADVGGQCTLDREDGHGNVVVYVVSLTFKLR